MVITIVSTITSENKEVTIDFFIYIIAKTKSVIA